MVVCAPRSDELIRAGRARGIAMIAAGHDQALALPNVVGIVVGHDAVGTAPCRWVARARQRGWTMPLLALVADDPGMIRALDAGADDAVRLPCAADAIAARVAALLRRSPPERRLAIDDLAIDLVERRVTRGGRPIALLPREYALLAHLARRAGRVATRAELLKGVWGLDFDPGTHVVEVHVSRLRARIDRGFARALLHTERGRGYRLGDEAPPALPPDARTG